MTDALLGVTGWVFREPSLGLTPVAKTVAAPTTTINTSTLAAGTLMTSPGSAGRSTPGRIGAIAKAYHPTFGEGEFIYLVGAASTVIGSVVTYDDVALSTTLAPSTANLDEPLAVAMSANVASQYGWYQIAGVATVAKSLSVKTTTVHVPVYLAGSGQVTYTAASGKQVLNAYTVNSSSVASATATTLVQINRPFAQGQVK